MDYGFSKTFIKGLNDISELTDRIQTIAQFFPNEVKYPALMVFTDKVEEVNTTVPGQERAKISFILKIISSYNGLQELYAITELLDQNFNGKSMESDEGYQFHVRLSCPTFEGMQKTKTCDYRSAIINGIGYAERV